MGKSERVKEWKAKEWKAKELNDGRLEVESMKSLNGQRMKE